MEPGATDMPTETAASAPVASEPASVEPAPVEPAAGSPASGGPITAELVKAALRKVKDPELNLNIVDLGLIYDVAVTDGQVKVDMSLTSPGCPSGPEIMGQADEAIKAIPGVGGVAMNLVWSPPWSPERIEPRIRAYLGF